MCRSLRIRVLGDKQGRSKIYIESFEMWCWQRLLRGRSWAEFRTNDNELNEIGQPGGLMQLNKERRWRLLGHTL